MCHSVEACNTLRLYESASALAKLEVELVCATCIEPPCGWKRFCLAHDFALISRKGFCAIA